MLSNIILDALATRFENLARARKWGKQLQDGSWVDLILFADNYWLIATNPTMLGNMTKAWLNHLGEY